MNGLGDGAPLLRSQGIHELANHGIGSTPAFRLQHFYSRFAAFLIIGNLGNLRAEGKSTDTEQDGILTYKYERRNAPFSSSRFAQHMAY